ncbi:alpha/beta hydrolase family protein [Enterovibrio coralii]|uniref:Alpha/beta hydrolase fold-3 domain-containing protein n=1 Tax=Enterovibrio coralii TaxID=294935 RepID=A0A135I4X1_9GAMM|nr:hypothetical protein [Enterovibrio coralii]KXF80501.1 hypothetical protein ATN88_07365 [Enterovibrio coralii]
MKNLRDYYLSGTSAARQLHFDTGDDTYFSPVPETKEAEASVLPIAAGMTQYYLPGHPGAECGKWKNELNLYNAESILTFSAFNVISLMDDIPLFMALGSEAYTADNSLSFFEQASDPKELLLFEGKGHFDLYWQPECVAPASEKLAAFLLSHA